VRIGRYRWTQVESRFAVRTDVEEALRMLEGFGAQDVVRYRVSGVCDLEGRRRLDAGVDAARARVRALVHEVQGLALEPTPEDIDALHADGYVGEVLQQLRTEQSGADAQRARDALVILARMLDEAQKRPERV
jgi:hypothetical protein